MSAGSCQTVQAGVLGRRQGRLLTVSVAMTYDCTWALCRGSLPRAPPMCADSQLMVLPTSFTSLLSRSVNTLLQCRPACRRGPAQDRCPEVSM